MLWSYIYNTCQDISGLVLNEAIQKSMNINMFLNVSVFMGKIIGMVKWGKTPV